MERGKRSFPNWSITITSRHTLLDMTVFPTCVEKLASIRPGSLSLIDISRAYMAVHSYIVCSILAIYVRQDDCRTKAWHLYVQTSIPLFALHVGILIFKSNVLLIDNAVGCWLAARMRASLPKMLWYHNRRQRHLLDVIRFYH